MKSPIELLQSLLLDIRRLEPDVKGLDRDIRTIKLRYKHEGYGFLTIALPSYADSFVEGLSVGKFSSPLGFKCSKGSVLPQFLGGLLSEVFEPSTGLVKENASGHIVKCVREILLLFKKVQLDSRDSDKLHREAVTGFFQNDFKSGQTFLSDRDEALLGVVCSMILPDLSVKDLGSIDYKHGPGAVEEGYRPNQKWKGVYEGIITDAFDTELHGFSDFALSDRIDLSAILPCDLSEIGSPRPLFTEASRGSARLISVPKNSTSRRTITIEPLLNQFIQQGLNTILRDSISRCGIMRNCLTLTDQSLNQKLALEGSIRRNWSTIDLKSASDLLSVKMVESVFGRHRQFLDAAFDCRSPTVMSDGVVHNIGKFAGMGNALTFPIQSVVFATLAITAIVDTEAKKPTYWSVKRASRHIRVFGDDIIVNTRYVHQVVSWLQRAGLIVNTKKSFLDGYFKESCGVDAYKGVDVTPIYCRFRPEHASTEAKTIEEMVAFSNNAWMRGLYLLAESVREEVERRLRKRLPLVSQQSGVLGWHSRPDAMHAHKWCMKHHQLLTKSIMSVSLKRRDRLDGWPALLKFFHVPLLGRPPKHLLETPVRFKLKIAKRWVPTRVGLSF